VTFDLIRLENIKDKTKDELYGWTEREHPGTPQYSAAMRELSRRKKRDDRVRVAVGVTILVLLLVAA
jgi:hypothetical protein